MKTFKILIINIIAATLLSSCGSPKIIFTPIKNIDKIVIKIVPLTEIEV